MFQNAFHDLLQITPDIFAGTVTGDPKLKIPVQTKGKDVSKKKNTAGLVVIRRRPFEKSNTPPLIKIDF